MGRLDGKLVIVTGAAQGMGDATAELIVAHGGQVIVADVNEHLGRSVSARLGAAARFEQLDVTSEADWDRVVATVMADFGRIDGLVNNAAIHWGGKLEDGAPDAFRRLIDIDLMGPWLGMRAIIPHMKAARRGSIVNIASVEAMTGYCDSSVYAAAKWGLRGMTKSVAKEIGAFGIRANVVAPGAIDTPMLRNGLGEIPFGEVFPGVAMNRLGDPHEVAQATVFMLSDEASYISGADLVVDGGWTCGLYTINKPTGD